MNRISHKILYAALAAGLLAAPGCMVSKSDFNTLQSQVYTQNKRMDELRDKVDELESQVNAVTEMRATQANMYAELEQIKGRLATVQGDVQTFNVQGGSKDTQTTLEEMKKQMESMRLALSSQLGVEIEGIPDSAPAPEASAPVPGVAPQQQHAATPAKQVDTTPEAMAKALYEKGLEHFKNKEYARAQSLWAEFVQTYPKNSLVANALFWQGEAFFQMSDYSRAVLAYQEVISKHPKSPKYPSALLKQGMAFYKMGNKKAGKLVLEDLVKQFPKSAEAKRAQTLLDENK